MFELWYNIKIGRARPCPSRENALWISSQGIPSPRTWGNQPLDYHAGLSVALRLPYRADFRSLSPLRVGKSSSYARTHNCGHFLVTPIDMELADNKGLEPLFVGWQPTVFTFGRIIRLGGFRPHLEVLVWVVKVGELNPILRKRYVSVITIYLDISQPCIYIISYSVEFVKRFSTLFLIFLCGFDFMFLLELSL